MPIMSARGSGPQRRESLESPRLSPIMKYMPLGTVMRPRIEVARLGVRLLQLLGGPPPAGITQTWPARLNSVSPGRPITRLM